MNYNPPAQKHYTFSHAIDIIYL